jgi:dTDP-4-dehydrorhamnose reductase
MAITIFIFGGSGMLGRYVVSVLKMYYNVECINRDTFDILNDSWDKLNSLLERLKPSDVLVNCAGIIPQKVDGKSSSAKLYFRVNSIFPHKIQYLADKIGFRFIHITTDCIFDGMRYSGDYSERDIKTENMETGIYGVSKALGEPRRACIIRTSIIGEELDHKKSLLEWVKSNAGGEIRGFGNHYWNGITCLTLANIIKIIINNKYYWRGVRHIYSPETISKYELCQIINDIYKLNIKIEKINNPAIRIINKSLKSLYNTCSAFKIPNIREQLISMKTYKLTRS